MLILAIDPGSEQSAVVIYDDELGRITRHGIFENADLIDRLRGNRRPLQENFVFHQAVIERVACYGMSVGEEVFEMVYQAGRMHEAIISDGRAAPHRMFRREAKLHLCNSVKASDSNIRTRLIDIFGGKDKAIGKKKTLGPLYGIRADEWSALALAITFADTWRKTRGCVMAGGLAETKASPFTAWLHQHSSAKGQTESM